jgi:hypothetical protein
MDTGLLMGEGHGIHDGLMKRHMKHGMDVKRGRKDGMRVVLQKRPCGQDKLIYDGNLLYI